MKKLVTVLAVLAAVLWSAAVWGGYALLVWTGAFVAENGAVLGLPAEARAWAAWAGVLLENFGQGTTVVLWLLGVGLIALAALIANTLLARLRPAGPSPARTPDIPDAPVERAATPAQAPRTAPAWGRDASPR